MQASRVGRCNSWLRQERLQKVGRPVMFHFQTCLQCRLYDANAFQPKYATQPAPPEPKPQRRAPSASIDRPTAQAEAADPPAAASSKPPRESSHAPKTLREGPTRPSGTSRSAKESVGRDSPRETRDANGKDSKEGSTRDTRDRGREASSRGSKEHGDKLSSAREGRDGSRAVGKAADDKQLADVRAAALKAAVNGTSGDAGSGRASARRDELVNGAKASGVNGTTAVPGTKRRVPDSGTIESR